MSAQIDANIRQMHDKCCAHKPRRLGKLHWRTDQRQPASHRAPSHFISSHLIPSVSLNVCLYVRLLVRVNTVAVTPSVAMLCPALRPYYNTRWLRNNLALTVNKATCDILPKLVRRHVKKWLSLWRRWFYYKFTAESNSDIFQHLIKLRMKYMVASF